MGTAAKPLKRPSPTLPAQPSPSLPPPALRGSKPAWIVSLVLHTSLFLALGAALHVSSKGLPGSPGDGTGGMEGGFSAKAGSGGGSFYDDEEEGGQGESQSQQVVEALLSEAPAARPSVSLPKSETGTVPWAGPSSAGSGGNSGGLGSLGAGSGSGSGSGTGSGNGRGGGGGGGKGKGTRTYFLNQSGEGNSFVFVVDRSASMESPNHLPINAAKAALKDSLKPLQDTNQFQIIFYNDKPHVFTLQGAMGGLLLADDRNKSLANRFIDGVIADGATRHKEALLMALKMDPDVIFFLTDGDQPSMNTVDLAAIQKKNNTTTIHVIQFGLTAYVKEDTWLVRLAQQNRGQFSYVNIHDWSKRQREGEQRGIRD